MLLNNELNLDIVNQLVEVSNSGIFWKNRDGKILGCNKIMLTQFGIENRDQIVGRSEYDFLSKEEIQKTKQIDRQVLEGQPFQEEYRVALDDDIKKVYLKSKLPLFDQNGQVIGIICTSVDVTADRELQRLEAESQRQKLELEYKVASVARKIAHDINSPLAVLKMVLSTADELSDVKRDMVDKAISRMIEITTGLFSTYKKPPPKSVSVEDDQTPA